MTSPTVAPPARATVRLDRWLNAARVFSSRSDAATACDGGKVDLNGSAAKPHKAVGPGDELRVTTHRGVRILSVLRVAEKRLSPPKARELYEDRTPPPPPEPFRESTARERGLGRPTKRERRDLDRWRGR